MFSSIHCRGLLPIVGLACGVLICPSAVAGQPVLEVVVYTGLDNSPPGFPGLYWNLGAGGFSSPVIDDSGSIAFQGTLFGDGIIPANNRVLWYGNSDNWTVVARNGDPTPPGLPGLTLLNITTNFPALSPNGNISISSSLAGPGITTANDTAFWYGPIGSLSLMAQESTTLAPGGAAMTASFGAMGVGNNFRANNAGQVLFNSNLTGGDVSGTTNNFGVYIGSSSGITEVARKGNPIPGAPALPDPSGPFMTPDSFGMLLNGAGEVVSAGTLVAGTAGGVTTNDDKVVYTTVDGAMRLVAREGDPVPGLTQVKYKNASSFGMATMGITNSGKVVFSATFDNIAPGTAVTAANDTGWLVDDHGTISMLVREGDSIDGEAFNFVQSSGGMFVNNNDQVLLVGAALTASNTSRIWTGPVGGPYTKVVQQGVTTLPGDPTVILDYTASQGNGAAFNNAGQIVFHSNLIGPGVTPGVNDRAILGWDPRLGLVLIARSDPNLLEEILDIAQFALIGSTGITGENGSAILTDNGWLTFRAQDVKGFQAIVRTKPFELCLADINGDTAVDIDDLFEVIGAWGPCDAECPEDIDDNGMVDIDDLFAVIGAWGVCY